MARISLDIDLNRVEGDLALQVDIEDQRIVDARCIGSMYRGFEQILIGRAPMDALVLTPRVCGICGTAHLYSAVLALEQLAEIQAPRHAQLVRNLCALAEIVQSDLRQSFLFFAPDLCQNRYQNSPYFAAISEAFTELKGTVSRSCLQVSRNLPSLVAIFAGQWPHSSWMVPGGITLPATARRILDSESLLNSTRHWFENELIGGPIAAWLALNSASDLDNWFAPASGRHLSAIGRLYHFCRDVGLDNIGQGTGHMISYGLPDLDEDMRGPFVPGFYNADTGQTEALNHLEINEHVRHSWFLDYGGGRHPWQGETIPHHQTGSDRYTWAKAPRYGEKVVQTGPLAELRISGEALIGDLLKQRGDSVWVRQFARLRRAAYGLQTMQQLLNALKTASNTPHIVPHDQHNWPDGASFGMAEAARGALGHWLRVKDGRIEKYQIVTPTAWNASPRDSTGLPGHWEHSLIGLEIKDLNNPIEIGHIVRSHDPCMVCTVHYLGQKMSIHV